MAPKVPLVKFNNGQTIPIFGLGTWKSQPGEVTQAVKDAISCGYRHIDCAHCYGNENEVGEALKAKIDDGTVKREDLFITSKLWLTSFREDLVVKALKKTLNHLGLEYLDLYLIHWPCGFKVSDEVFPRDSEGKLQFSDVHYTNVWKGMEEAQKAGLTKSIGVSNFNKRQVGAVLDMCSIKPVTNQVECHPYFSQKKLTKYCKDNDIVLTAYSPLGSPDRPKVDPNHPILLQNQTLKDIGDKYKKNPGQVLIRYQIQNGNVVIPKSVTKSRIETNFEVFDFELTPSEMATLEGLSDKNVRFLDFDMIDAHPEYPFNDEY